MSVIETHEIDEKRKQGDVACIADLFYPVSFNHSVIAICLISLRSVNAIENSDDVDLMLQEYSVAFFFVSQS